MFDPISPVTFDTRVLVTGPVDEKMVKHSTAPKVGATGPFKVTLPHPGEINAITPFTVIAPVVVSALPSIVSPALMFMAALFTITVPRIYELVPILSNPSTFQNTLQDNAPFSSTIFEFALVDNGPCTLIINTAPGIPFASRYKVEFNTVAPVTECTPAISVSPFPMGDTKANVAMVAFN